MRQRIRDWFEETHGTRFELLRHFLARFFDSDLVATPGEWAKVAAGVAGVLASLWIILARVLAAKYSALIRYSERSGLNLADLCRHEFRADQLMLIVLAMSATMLLVAVLWWSMYPTLRDYRTLACLPIRASEIFTAKLAGLLLVFGTFVLIVAAPAAIILYGLTVDLWKPYPSALSSIASTFAAMGAGCGFVFFTLMALQGLMLNLLPGRLFERVSAYTQALLVVIALGSFPLVDWKASVFGDLHASATTILIFVTLPPVLAIGAYLLGYRRYRRVLLEAPPKQVRERPDRLAWLTEVWIRDPREQAAYWFIWKTLSRSRIHRLAILVYAGLGVAYVLRISADFLVKRPAGGGIDNPVLAAGPLSLALFSLLGLRYLFSLPVDLGANWMFQITEREGRIAWLRAVERFVLWFGAGPPLVLGAILVAGARGVFFAIAWAPLAFFFVAIAFEYLFRDWSKMPHTCSYLPGKRSPIFTLALCIVLLFGLMPLVWIILLAAASNPFSFLAVFGIELAVWWYLHRARSAVWAVLPLRYEEQPNTGIESFGLASEGTTLAQEQFRREWSDYLRSSSKIPIIRPLEHGETARQRVLRWLAAVPPDLHHAARVLRKSPAFALAAVLTLGLGLGLNAAFFAVFNAFLLRPLAVRDAHNLVSVEFHARDGPVFLSPSEYEDLRVNVAAFSGVIATGQLQTRLDGRPAKGLLVSRNYFSLLGVTTTLGRSFQTDDSASVAVLSYRAWRNRFGSDESIIGRKLMVQGFPFDVIGVATPEFTGLEMGGVDLWIPIEIWNQLPGVPRANLSRITARLRSGISKEAAQALLTTYAQRLANTRQPIGQIFRARLEFKATPFASTALRFLVPFLIAFGLTMAIPCSNAANIMLARALARQREISIRLALGASRGRVIRQLLAEGLLISMLAGAAGLAFARVTLDLVLRLVYATAPSTLLFRFRIPELTLDTRVFLYMLIVSAITTVAFALVPAAQATRPDVSGALRGELGSSRSSRLRDALVIGQVAVCVMLLVAAGVFIRGGHKLASVDLGYDPRGVYAVSREAGDRTVALGAALERESWVETLAYGGKIPTDMGSLRVGVPRHPELSTAYCNFVSPDYFRLMRIALVRGRTFTQKEARTEASVVVVSETVAKLLWPGAEPVGKTLSIPFGGSSGSEWRPRFDQAEVVGVTRDIVARMIEGVGQPSIHFPSTARLRRPLVLMVRGKGDPTESRRLIEAAMSRILGANESAIIVAMEEPVAWESYPQRAASWLSSLLGGVALLLTVTGVYGVVSHLVSQRTREIGIRMVVGATRPQVVQMVLSHSARLAVIGLGFGAVLALGFSMYFSSTLGTMINVYDLAAYLLGPAAVILSVFGAALGPALHASRLNPMDSLRL